MARKQTATNDRVISLGDHCRLCWNREGQKNRHEHFLTFGDSKELEAHLLGQYGEERMKDGTIPAILHWYYDQKDQERKRRERQE